MNVPSVCFPFVDDNGKLHVQCFDGDFEITPNQNATLGKVLRMGSKSTTAPPPRNQVPVDPELLAHIMGQTTLAPAPEPAPAPVAMPMKMPMKMPMPMQMPMPGAPDGQTPHIYIMQVPAPCNHPATKAPQEGPSPPPPKLPMPEPVAPAPEPAPIVVVAPPAPRVVPAPMVVAPPPAPMVVAPPPAPMVVAPPPAPMVVAPPPPAPVVVIQPPAPPSPPPAPALQPFRIVVPPGVKDLDSMRITYNGKDHPVVFTETPSYAVARVTPQGCAECPPCPAQYRPVSPPARRRRPRSRSPPFNPNRYYY